jgi:hypothetical protein
MGIFRLLTELLTIKGFHQRHQASVEMHFLSHVSVNICCGVTESQDIRQFVLEKHLTRKTFKRYLCFLADELTVLPELSGYSYGFSKIVHCLSLVDR